MAAERITVAQTPRIRVFVDYWNFQLGLNFREGEGSGHKEQFPIDWHTFPNWAAERAAEVAGAPTYSFEGCIIYTSFDPHGDPAYRNWATTWLDRQPGVQVDIKERQAKDAPVCANCHQEIRTCPHCHQAVGGTTEKGVDTAIATDLIRLAWEDAYDIAVLVTSDKDLVPAVTFLDQKGRKVIQAGFPPAGGQLATACWASFDVFKDREAFRRSKED